MHCSHRPNVRTIFSEISICKKCDAQLILKKNYKYIIMKICSYSSILGIALKSPDIRLSLNTLCIELGWQNSAYGKVFIGILYCLLYSSAMSIFEVLFRTLLLDYAEIHK